MLDSSPEEKTLLEEPKPVLRQIDEMINDAQGNLVDKDTGKVLVKAAKRDSLVADGDGNLVDKDTGIVLFDQTGVLVADKEDQADFESKRETLLEKIKSAEVNRSQPEKTVPNDLPRGRSIETKPSEEVFRKRSLQSLDKVIAEEKSGSLRSIRSIKKLSGNSSTGIGTGVNSSTNVKPSLGNLE